MPSYSLYLVFINVLTASIYGWDKWQAIRRGPRIPEKTLIGLALLGGTGGGLAMMYIFRHKIRHPLFRWGMPILLLLQAATVYYLGRC